MTLATQEIERQMGTSNGTQALTITPAAIEATPVIEATNVAHYDPNAQIKGNGIRGPEFLAGAL